MTNKLKENPQIIKDKNMYVFEVHSSRRFNIFAKDEETAYQKLLDSEEIEGRDVISCIEKNEH